MTIGQLKTVLQQTLDEIDGFEDKIELQLQSNTYFLKGARYFLGVSGYDGGYLDLDKISEALNDDELCPECHADLEWDDEGYNAHCPSCGWEDN